MTNDCTQKLVLQMVMPKQDQPWTVYPWFQKGNPQVWSDFFCSVALARQQNQEAPRFKIETEFVGEREALERFRDYRERRVGELETKAKALYMFLGDHFSSESLSRLYQDKETIGAGVDVICGWTEREEECKDFDMWSTQPFSVMVRVPLTPAEIRGFCQDGPVLETVDYWLSGGEFDPVVLDFMRGRCSELAEPIIARKLFPEIVKTITFYAWNENPGNYKELCDSLTAFQQFIPIQNWQFGLH